MSREIVSEPSSSKNADTGAGESLALLAEVQKARNFLQAVLMGVLEGSWTEEHGRDFSLLYPPHTSPGGDKFKVLNKFHEVMQASEQDRAKILSDLLSKMKENSLDHRIKKHAGQDMERPQSASL